MSRSNSSTERIDTSIYEQNFRRWISDWLICKPTSPKDKEQQKAAEESSNSVLRRTWQGVKENQQAKVDQTPLECDTKLLKVDLLSIQASLSDLRQIFLFPTQDIHWGYYQTKQEYFRPVNQRNVSEKTVDSQLDNLFSDVHAVVSKMFKKWQLVTDGDSTIVTSAQSRDDRKKFASRGRFKKRAIQLMDIAKRIIELKPDGSHTGQTEQFLILLFESSETDIGTKLKALSVLFYTYVMFNQSLDRILCLAVMLRRMAFDAQYSHAKISRSAHDLFMTSLSNLSRFSIGEGFKYGNSNSNRSNSNNKNATDNSVGGSCFEKVHKTVPNHRLVEDVTQLHKKSKEKLLCKFSDHFLYWMCRELDRLLTEFETGSFKIARIACSEQNKNIRSTFVYIPFVIHQNAISSLSQILKCCTEQIKHATSPESHSMQCYCSMIFLRLLSTNMNNSNFGDQLSRTSLRSRQVQYEEVIHQLEDYCRQCTLHNTPELVTMLGHECSQVPLVSPLIYFLDTVCSVSTAKLPQSELTLLNDERGHYYTRACVSLLVLLYPDTGARDGMYLTHLQRFLFDLLTNGLLQYSSQLLEQAEDPSRLILNERFTHMLSLIALLYISVSLPIVRSLSSYKLKSLVTGVDALLDIIKKTPNCDGKATLLHMLTSIYCDCVSVLMWRDVNRMWLSPSHIRSQLMPGVQVPIASNATLTTFNDDHRKQLTSFICSMWRKFMDSFYSSTVDLMSGFSHSNSELFDLILQCLQSMLITQIHHTHNSAQINVLLSRLESLNLDDEFWMEYETIWRFILDFFVCLDRQTLQFQICNLQEACNYLLCLPPIDQTKDDTLLFTEAIPRFQRRFFPYLYTVACIEPLETVVESRAFSWKYVQRLLRHKLEGDDGRMKQHLHGCVEAIMQQAPSDLSNSFACYSLSMYSPATQFSLLRSVTDAFQECYTELIQYFDLFHNERSTIQVVTTTVWFDFLACRVVLDGSSFSVSNHDIRALFYNLGCDTLASHCGATYHPSIRHCPIPHEEKLASMRKRYLFFVLAKLLTSDQYRQQACDTLFDILDEIPMVVHNSATCDQKLTLLGVLYFMLMIVLPKDENIKPGDVVRFDDGSIGIISHIDTVNGHRITTMSIDNRNLSHQDHRYRTMTHHDSTNEFKTEHSTLRDQLQQQFMSVKLLDKLKFLLEAETESNSSIDYVAMMKTCITKVISSPNLLSLVIQVPNMTKLLVSLAKKPLNFLYYQSAEKINRPHVLCCCGKYLSDDGGIRLIDLYELYYRMPHDIQSLYAYLANVKSFQDAMMGLERRRNFREIFEYLPSLIMHRPDLREYYHINKLTVTALGETPAEMLRANYTFPSTCQVLSILVSVEEATSESFLSFGLAPETHNLNGLPGWFNNSMGYHSDGELHVADQFLVGQSRCITTYDAQSPLAQNDIFLFMYDRELRRIDVSRNGITILSDLCPEISVVRLFPVIQVSGAGTRVTLSFPLDATKWIRNVDEVSTTSNNNEALLQHCTTIGWINGHEKEFTKPDSIEVGTIMKIVDEHENRYAIVVDMMKKQMQVASLNSEGKVQLLWVKRKQLTKNNNHPLLPPNISIEQKDRILRQYYMSNPVLYARELLYNVLSHDTTLSHLVDIITDKPVLATLFSLFVYDNISRMDTFGDVAQDIQSSDPTTTTTTRDFFNQFFLRSSANISKLVSDRFHDEDSVVILRHTLKLIDECLSRYISQDGPYCRTFASTKMTHCTEVFIPNAKGLKIHLDRSKIALFEEDTLSFSTRRNFDFTSGEGYELSAGVSIENRTISSNKVYFRFKKSPSSESRYAFKVTPTGISFRNEDAVIENIWANPSILLWAVNILTRVSEDQRVRQLLVSRHEGDLLSMIHKSVQYLLQVDVPLQSSMTHLLQILCHNILPHCSNKEAASGLWPRIRSSLDEYQLEQANDIISILSGL